MLVTKTTAPGIRLLLLLLLLLRDTLGRARGKFFVAMRMRGKTGAQSGVSMITRGGPLTGDGCWALAMAAA